MSLPTAAPARLASMHEWTGVADGAVAILAGIHYDLFLGSLADHDSWAERDLTDVLAMRRTGTFLCTELGGRVQDELPCGAVKLGGCAQRGGRRCRVLWRPRSLCRTPARWVAPKPALVAAKLLIDGKDQPPSCRDLGRIRVR